MISLFVIAHKSTRTTEMAAKDIHCDKTRFRNALPAEANLDEKEAVAIFFLENYQYQNWTAPSLSKFLHKTL